MKPTPVRIQRSRKQKQVSPNGLPIKYVGRPGKWGNPFRVKKKDGRYLVLDEGEPIFVFDKKDDAVECVIYQYKRYVKHMILSGDLDISKLKDKNLSCWCSLDCQCHADVLLELANAEK